METKQISLFCLLLAALAGKIETKPSGSLNTVTAGEAQLSSISAASVGQSNVDQFSSGISGLQGISGYSDTLGNYGRRGSFGQDLTQCSGILGNSGRLGSFGQVPTGCGGTLGNYGQQGSFGQFGALELDQGLGGGFGNCQQGIGRIGIPVNSGCCTYQQFTPGCNILGGVDQFTRGSANYGLDQDSNLGISGLTGLYDNGGLYSSSLPCSSYNQVGTQDLGFGNIFGNCRGCQSGLQGIPFSTGCDSYQQSLAGCTDFGLSCQQGITASASCGVCQGITGTTGRGACQRGSPCMVDSNNVDYLQLQPSVAECDCDVLPACTEPIIDECACSAMTTC